MASSPRGRNGRGFGESVTIDTGLVAAAPKRSNTMRWRATAPLCMGRSLNMPKAAALLSESLREEMKAEKFLTQVGASKADKIAATKMAG
jgi:hypothetical protein